ncbi:hypothetical protein IscW_ISCW000219 [Ixodes scapularis]|uniref:Secreted protein n=1 Tax=Ixodes scapularis TaxID=6945 RepID=B7P6K3_IXOSC|nr:hypothetical protein IscW_ISCW000219 [Ixodes scapularis]|eukprot:XP_002408997.1 hypothetical protein IscW_ISCW000219 [Ixodes scapularis]
MQPVVALLAFAVVALARPRSSEDQRPSKSDVPSDTLYDLYPQSKHVHASYHKASYRPGHDSYVVPQAPYHSVIDDSSDVIDDYEHPLKDGEHERAVHRGHPRRHSTRPRYFKEPDEDHMSSRYHKRSVTQRPNLDRSRTGNSQIHRSHRIPFTIGYVGDNGYDLDWLSFRPRHQHEEPKEIHRRPPFSSGTPE